MFTIHFSCVFISPSLLTPEIAMLTGRGVVRFGVVLLFTEEFVVDVDIALPGLDNDILFGVISPERRPKLKYLIWHVLANL